MPTYPKLVPPLDGDYYTPDQGTQYKQADGTVFSAPDPTGGAFRYQQDRSLDADNPGKPTSLSTVADALQANRSPFQRLAAPAFSPPAAAAGVTAPAASPFKTLLTGLMGKAGAAAKSAGAAVARDPLGAANIGLGLAGAVEYATARAPKLPGVPDVYAPAIRPAQGLNAAALSQGRAQIQATQRQASRPTGSDSGTATVQRLFAQAQAGDQQNQLTAKDNEAYQQDQRRVDEQSNAAYQANYQTQRSYKEKVFDLGQRAYEARRQQGAAMSQAALTYFTQARASNLNSQERQKESALYAQYGIAPPRLRARTGSGRTSGSTTTTSTDDTEQYARGGKLTARLSFGTSRERSRDNFSQRQDKVTAQSQRAFSEAIRAASAKRSRGFKDK